MKPILYPLILILSLILVGCEKTIFTYYENGNIEEKIRVKKEISIGSKGFKLNDVPHGLFEIFHENGELQTRVNFLNGEIEGLSETFDEDGRFMGSSNYVNGKKDGIDLNIFPDGTMLEVPYKNGKKYGLSRTIFADGSSFPLSCYQNDEEVDMSFCEGENNNE